MNKAEQNIISKIKNDPVPIVSECEVLAACKVATSYYAENQTAFDKNFWRVTLSCLSVESSFFWVLLSFLLGCCAMLSLFVTGYGIEPIAIMSAFAPVPVITFAIRELQYRDSNLVQIEKTCKYAPQKIYFARLWIGMLINAIWVLITGVLVFFQYENFSQLFFCSFITMFLIGAVALLLMSLTDSTLPLSLMMATWVLCAVFLMSGDEFIHIVTATSVWLLAVLTTISLGIFVGATIRTTVIMYA